MWRIHTGLVMSTRYIQAVCAIALLALSPFALAGANASASHGTPIVAGRYEGFIVVSSTMHYGGMTLARDGKDWKAALIDVGEPGDPLPKIQATTHDNVMEFDVQASTGVRHCRATLSGRMLRSASADTCIVSAVRVDDTGLASRHAGLWRDDAGHAYTITAFFSPGNIGWYDYQNGDWRHLYEVDNRLQSGPGLFAPLPVRFTLQPRGDQLVMHREGHTQLLHRVDIRERELSWTSGDAILKGTLLMPANARGPVAAVVLTHMAGNSTRDGYHEFANYFVSRGMAALIYDRRGSGKSTGTEASAGMHQLADDAIAAVHLLMTQPGIDPARIGTWGHSQGGWLAPMAAARSPDVHFVIAQSARAVTAAEQEVFRVEHMARAAGMSNPDVAAAVDYERLLMTWVRTGEGREKIVAISKQAKNAPWASVVELREDLPEHPSQRSQTFWNLDPVPDLERVHVPILVIHGDRDAFVPVPVSVERMRAAFARSGADAEFHLFPSTQHGMWVGNGASTDIATTTGFHPQFWPTLGAWLSKHGLDAPVDKQAH